MPSFSLRPVLEGGSTKFPEESRHDKVSISIPMPIGTACSTVLGRFGLPNRTALATGDGPIGGPFSWLYLILCKLAFLFSCLASRHTPKSTSATFAAPTSGPKNPPVEKRNGTTGKSVHRSSIDRKSTRLNS